MVIYGSSVKNYKVSYFIVFLQFHWLFLMLAMSFSQAGPLLSSKPVSFHSSKSLIEL